MSRARHTRQVRLAEVGEEGQARIAATTAAVDAEGLAGAVEVRYLAGAGVGRIATSCEPVADAARAADHAVQIVGAVRVRLGLGSPPAFEIRDASALEVALGSWRALAHIRRAVQREGTSSSAPPPPPEADEAPATTREAP